MSDVNNDQKALLQKAILEIRDLKARLKRVTDSASESIAIIGASCRFPAGANSLDAYWDLLINGRDGISEVPAERWDAEAYYDPDPDAPGKICTKKGGFLDIPAYAFDAAFFGISPREAESLDPQQRLLLELSWEAIEQANINPESLFKSNTGVFMGISSLDNATRIIGEAPLTDIDGYYGTGIALAPAAGRISYHFGLTGPSYVVDTACSSSLLSLHLASESLRRGECTMALAGGVQLLIHPGVSVAFTKARMLSPDGCCKTFDDTANGYVRGEGGGVVLLKKMSDALRDGDRILAVIKGSAVNQDGASGGLTVPSGPSQEAVIRKALEQSGLSSTAVSYIEAHGTGTPLGDPIEIGGLTTVYGRGRTKDQPLRVGSVKTNIGHLEASAGIASAIKVMLSLMHGKIAPSLHFRSPNKLVPWNEIPIQVPVEPTEWIASESGVPRTAGISSFGFSGTNVHLIMQEAPVQPVAEHQMNGSQPGSEQLLVLSAKTKTALVAQAKKHAQMLLGSDRTLWPAYTNTAATMRTAFRHRLAIASDCPLEASKQLESWALGNGDSRQIEGIAHEGVSPKVLMLFSGQGSQYVGMGKSLYETSAEFRKHIDICNAVMQPILGHSIHDILFSGEHNVDSTQNTQPALFALEVSLALTWKTYGGAIHGVIGHSVGEYAAAVVAGVLSLHDAAKLITHRGALMQHLASDGGMIAVFTRHETVAEVLSQLGDHTLSIAAVNGKENVVVSGLIDDLNRLKQLLSTIGLDFRDLRVSHAFHSSLMQPMIGEFKKMAEEITFSKPQIPFYTNLTGSTAPDLVSTSDYWVRQIREAVLFDDAVSRALDDAYTLVIEAGPKSTLINLARLAAARIPLDSALQQEASWLPMLSPVGNDKIHLLTALGSYWCQGSELEWATFTRGRTDLPLYEFERSLFRKDVVLDAGSHANHAGYKRTDTVTHRLMQRVTQSPLLDAALFESDYRASDHRIFQDHRVFGQFVVAGAAHVSLTIAAAQHYFDQVAVELKEVFFPQALVLPSDGSRWIHLSIRNEVDDAKSFKLISGEADDSQTRTHAIGKVEKLTSHQPQPQWQEQWGKCPLEIDSSVVYETQRKRHIDVGESYRWLKSVRSGKGVALATLEVPDQGYESGYGLHPGLIDSCFGILALTVDMDIDETFIPFGVASVKIFRLPNREVLRACAQMRVIDPVQGKMIGDISIETEQGEVIIVFEGMEGRKASAAALIPDSALSSKEFIYETRWTSDVALQQREEAPRSVMIVPEGFGTELDLARLGISEALFFKKGTPEASVNAGVTVLDPSNSVQLDAYWSTRARKPEMILVASDIRAMSTTVDAKAYPIKDESDHILSGLNALLHVVQSLKRCGLNIPLVPVTVVSPSQSASPHITACAASVHAFVRSARKEHDPFSGAEIFMDADVTGSIWLGNITQWNVENESVWIRNDGVRYARLAPKPFDGAPMPVFDAQAVYLISGGLGSLAHHLVGYLAARGAREFILVARSHNEQAEKELRGAYAEANYTFHILQADVAHRESLQQALAVVAEPIGRLKGVFHLAGKSVDASIDQVNEAQLIEAIQPKYHGALHLSELFKHQPLDFFVVYSSLAAVLGNAGQVAYSAANAATDALLDRLSQRGTPVYDIRWGPWQNMGMMSRLGESAQRFIQAQGIRTITPEQASQALDAILGSIAPLTVTVADIDWSSNFQHLALVRDLRSEVAQPSGEASFVDTLASTPMRQRNRRVVELLNQMLTRALRMAPDHQIDPHERLFDLGVDSLIAIELKNKLQVVLQRPVSSTLLFDYPSLEALSKHILTDLLGNLDDDATQTSIVVDQAPSRHHDTLDIDALSDEAAEEELLKALNQIQGLKG
jgi:acyl transferase domain-containing protein/acyl carrier protein